MARPFTSNGAKELIEKYRNLSEQIAQISKSTMRYRSEAKEKLHELSESGTFERRARDEFFVQEKEIGYQPQLGELMQKLYCCLTSNPVLQEIRDLQAIDQKIQAALVDLTPGTSGFQWLFAGRRKKDKASEAYEMLMDIGETNYAEAVLKLTDILRAIEKVTPQAAWGKFDEDRELYRTALENVDRSFLKQKESFSEIQEILEKHETYAAEITAAEDMIGKSQSLIKEAAESCMTSSLMAILREVPVEELNRDKSGVRVKTLRDNGYETMEDIYHAPRVSLENIPGISWDGSFLIKQKADIFAKEARKGIKIRLNADEKTAESTQLVEELYLYKKRMELVQQLKDLKKSESGKITKARHVLEQFENEYFWLFYPIEEKSRMMQAYQYLMEVLSGDYFLKTGELATQIQTLGCTEEEAWEDFSKNNITSFQILEELVPGMMGSGDGIYGLPEELAEEVQTEDMSSDGLNCSLRKYQEWGVKYALHQGNVLLGDEMGLGKTIQAIATMVALKNMGATHFVVVCPASVLPNWCKEIAEKSQLHVTKVHGSDRIRSLKAWIKNGGVAVTTFETTGFFELEEDFMFTLLVVDEAHYIKNREAQRTKNVTKLSGHAERKLFMTGTALENKVDEMISLVDILNPDIASKIGSFAFMASAPQFRKRIASVYYRRKRDEVLTELPELIESKEWCTLSLKERIVYEAHVWSKNFSATRQVSWNGVKDLKDSCKAKRMLELIEEAEAEGRKVIVFSFFLDTIRKIQEFLGDRCSQPINGSIPPQRRQQIIDEFDKAPAGSVLLAQIQAGGTGLNIQSASVVILCEPQLKPSIENQAISRAYRMGQSRNVLVYRLLCEDTIDERIMDILEQKQMIFDTFADISESAAEGQELDQKSLNDIMEEELEKIRQKQAEQEAEKTGTEIVKIETEETETEKTEIEKSETEIQFKKNNLTGGKKQ